jgi:hypothetical protein
MLQGIDSSQTHAKVCNLTYFVSANINKKAKKKWKTLLKYTFVSKAHMPINFWTTS